MGKKEKETRKNPESKRKKKKESGPDIPLSLDQFLNLNYVALIDLLKTKAELAQYLQTPDASRITAALLKTIALSGYTCLGISSLNFQKIKSADFGKLKSDGLDFLVIYDDTYQTNICEAEKTVRILSFKTEKVFLEFMVKEFSRQILNDYELLCKTVAGSLVLEFMKIADQLSEQKQSAKLDTGAQTKSTEFTVFDELLLELGVEKILRQIPPSQE